MTDTDGTNGGKGTLLDRVDKLEKYHLEELNEWCELRSDMDRMIEQEQSHHKLVIQEVRGVGESNREMFEEQREKLRSIDKQIRKLFADQRRLAKPSGKTRKTRRRP